LGLIDEGEADWKVICINVTDPMAEKLNDIHDVDTHMPGLLDATRDWFRMYKVPTGKPENNFAADGKFYDRAFALDIIEHDNKCWENLANGGYDAQPEKKKGIQMENTCCNGYLVELSKEDAAAIVETESEAFNPTPASIDREPIDTVYYLKRSAL